MCVRSDVRYKHLRVWCDFQGQGHFILHYLWSYRLQSVLDAAISEFSLTLADIYTPSIPAKLVTQDKFAKHIG